MTIGSRTGSADDMRRVQRGDGGQPAGGGSDTPPGGRPDGPAGLGSARGRALTQRWLVLATGLAAAIPVIVATAQIVADRWVPLGDDALIAVRSLDVLTRHSPLVGEVSSGTSTILGQPAFHLGPLLYWLLALPARFMDASALEVTMGLVNVASVMAIVGLAHRRGGRPLMFAAAIAVPLMLASVPADAYADVWNPSAPLLPFTLLVLLAWSLACGEYRLLPVSVLVASFVVQCHLTYLLPTLGALAVGLGGLTGWRRSLRGRRDLHGRQSGDPRRAARRWIIGAAAVGLVCWSAPLLDQAVHRPGNLVLLERAAVAKVPKLGVSDGWHALVRAVGIVPWWLRKPQVAIVRVADLIAVPGALAVASTVLILGGLAAAMLAARRRGRRDVVAAAALGFVLCAALVLVTASTPRQFADTLSYSLWWAAPVGMWVALALGWSLYALLGAAGRLAPRRALAPCAFAGVLAAAAVGSAVATSADRTREPYREMRTIAARLKTALPGDRATRVDASSTDATFMALGFQAGIVYALRAEGRPVTVSGTNPAAFGSGYESRGRADEQVVRVDVDSPPPAGGRVIARLAVPDYPAPRDPFAPKVTPERAVVVTFLPASAGH